MNHLIKLVSIITLGILAPGVVMAQQDAIVIPSPYEQVRYFMIGFAVFLLLVILVLGRAVKALSVVKSGKIRKAKKASTSQAFILLAICALLPSYTFAQEASEVVAKEPYWLFTIPADVIVLTIIIIFEMLIIMILVKIQFALIKEPNDKVAVREVPAKSKWASFFTKINNTVDIEDEDSLDLQHDYDGIRELDNRIPKWWLYAFYGTILISVVYMYRMFVSETMPDQITELHEANRIADIKMKEYLKNAANNVDENTVVMLDASGIEAGKVLYNSMGCATCHGAVGEGNAVGPNLADDYWLHKGSINDIFYSIKYGWPEKGMKSWKDDMSPVQIAQIASYIKSLKGTNPPNAREPQGELYTEEATSTETADSAVAQQ